MTLQEWLKSEGRTQKWVADKLGIPTFIISNLVCNRSEPDVEAIVKIHDLTKGKVRVNDWLEQIKENRILLEKIAQQNFDAARSELP